MPDTPLVSVVMSVYNDETRVQTSIAGILKQTFEDFEFIIINDGSTDNTAQILDQAAAQDPRIRVIHQDNTGLTKALIRGCSEAQGEFIARQDAGDISLPERLHKQLTFLHDYPDAVMVAASTRFVGPCNEHLFDAINKNDEVEKGLAQLDVEKIKGPSHHGAVIFRKDAYNKVGGYRSTFVVAQDIDLWLRLVEIGKCMSVEDILYQAILNVEGISSLKRHAQYQLGDLAVQCAKLRRSGHTDQGELHSFSLSNRNQDKNNAYRGKAISYYFVASCLRSRQPLLSVKYYFYALRTYLQFILRIS